MPESAESCGLRVGTQVAVMSLIWIYLIIILAIGLGAAVVVPNWYIPDDGTLPKKDVLELRDKMRATIAQLAGGLAVIVTFLHTVIQSTEDLSQRRLQQSGDQIAKALAELKDDKGQWNAIGSIFVLGDVAKREPTFHRSVFETITRYIQSESQKECRAVSGEQIGEFRTSPRVQAALRVFSDRNLANEPDNEDRYVRKWDLSSICLVGVDLFQAKSFYIGRSLAAKDRNHGRRSA